MASTSLRTRVSLLAVVGVVLLALLALVVWTAFADARDVGREVTEQLSPAADASNDLVVAFDATDRESRTYVVTGTASSEARYRAARARSDADLARLRSLVHGDPGLAARLAAVETSSAHWLDSVVEPGVAARGQGPLSPFELVVFLDQSSTAYAPVATATAALADDVSAARDAAADQLATVVRRLAVALAGSALALLAGIVGAYLLVRRWVLDPLDSLRGQLREVADGQHERVIDPSGPPELLAVGVDAESMRRALVAQEDAARAAGEGLAQEGPVVSALRADLASDPDPSAAHLVVHGRVHAAHGVLAGDWWGTVPLEGDRTALLVVDVAGHGELAGLVAQRLRSVLTVSLRSGFDAGTVLTRGATSFVDSVDGRFATALLAVLDPVAGQVSWANAGHPAGWVLPAGDPGRRRLLDPTGPLLSTLGGAWTTQVAPLGVGDVVLAWSDGLVESGDGRIRSDDELAQLLAGVPDRDPRGLVEGLLAALRQQTPDWLRDDITLVAARRTS